jgi:hypothetical protein
MKRGDRLDSLETSGRVPSAGSPEDPDIDLVEAVVVGGGQAGLAIGFFQDTHGEADILELRVIDKSLQYTYAGSADVETVTGGTR